MVSVFFVGLLMLSACNKNEKPVRFGVIADCQYCDCQEAGTRFYRNSIEKLQAAVDTFNTYELDFVFHLGDFIDRDLQSFDTVNAILHQSEAIVYHVLGNHDFSVKDEDKHKVAQILKMPDRYYSVYKKDWKFIILDGNDLSFQRYPADEAPAEVHEMFQEVVSGEKPNAYNWNGGIGKEQKAWLIQQLDEAKEKGLNVILLCHFPLFPSNAHNLWNDEEIISLIGEYDCVKVWLNGHNHAGEYGVKDEVHYITMKGMVETSQSSAFAIVDLTRDSLNMSGYGRVDDLLLRLKQ